MEDQNQKELKKPWDDIIRYEYDTARRKEEIFNATLAYFQTNEKTKKYLEQFNQEALLRSLKSYAWQKARWLADKDHDEYLNDYRLLEDKNKAEECLENIQQRKLFQKQCEWRAELFTHPAIETSDDFRYWEHNILNCPFIDPITSEDIELYIEFMNVYFGENLAFAASWQDYDSYCTDRPTVLKIMNESKEEEDDDEEDDELNDDDYNAEEEYYDDEEEEDENSKLMPPWYLFWDERRGAGNYRMLPDIRKPKELVYRILGQDEANEKIKKEMEANPPDRRHFLTLYGSERLIPFIEQYEDPAQRDEILKAYEVYQRIWCDKEEEKAMYWVKEAWNDLSDCWQNFPIAPGITDWKEALIQTAKNWQHHKLINLIPIVYDEYLFRIDTGIEHPYDHEQAAIYREFADKAKATILRGRELKGEPRDLDF